MRSYIHRSYGQDSTCAYGPEPAGPRREDYFPAKPKSCLLSEVLEAVKGVPVEVDRGEVARSLSAFLQ